MLADLYQDGKLIASTNNKEVSQLFKSFYYWKNDTLNIDGGFGLFGGFGFNIKIIDGKANPHQLVASDEFPSYSYDLDDRLIFRLEVPCTETKITLYSLPDIDKKQTIYGYVEFKSKDYYAVNGEEIKPRKRNSPHMKLYFKSDDSPF